jgi:hypothetical protein
MGQGSSCTVCFPEQNDMEAFHGKFSAPQWQYFVTILHCDANKTLLGMLRQVSIVVTISGISRFLISTAWSEEQLTVVRYRLFRQQAQRSKRRGRKFPI